MIIPIEQLKREATQAASKYSDINDACPYPFHTDAGQRFKEFFDKARKNSKTVPGLRGEYVCVWSKE